MFWLRCTLSKQNSHFYYLYLCQDIKGALPNKYWSNKKSVRQGVKSPVLELKSDEELYSSIYTFHFAFQQKTLYDILQSKIDFNLYLSVSWLINLISYI